METATKFTVRTTVGGYFVLFLLCGTWYYFTYYLPKHQKNKAVLKEADVTAGVKKREKAQKPKQKTKPVASVPTSEKVAIYQVDGDGDAEAAATRKVDQDFARQFASIQAGTKLNTAKSTEKRQKSVKQSKAQEKPESSLHAPQEPSNGQKVSVPSSGTGDADDDLSATASPSIDAVPSPIASPPVQAAGNHELSKMSEPTSPPARAVDSRDVSDMLEPSTTGPSILRLTDTDKAKHKQTRTTKAPEPVETKKQRQNRKKAEAAKALRAAEEEDRKVKLEAQRRQARVAERRAAKDGSAFLAANAPNAWDAKGSTNGASTTANGNTADGAEPHGHASDNFLPLDTQEQNPPSAGSASALARAQDAKSAPASWMASMPPYEEQLDWATQDDDDSWSEVPIKKRKSKKSEADTSAPATTTVSAPTAVKKTVTKPVVGSHSSFAALTPEVTKDIEDNTSDVEVEWDV